MRAPVALVACRAILALALVLSLSGCGGEEDPPETPSAADEIARVEARAAGADPDDGTNDLPVIVFLGTSLTAGYGLEESQAYPALIEERLQAEGLAYRVINAGVSGDTSAGGLRRLPWLLRMPVAVLVLELGANDMLRGLDIEQLRTNLETILDQTREAHPRVKFVVSGMRAAPNLGRDYVERFDSVYPALAEKYGAPLVPFLLEDVAAKRTLNQADGIHPTAEGHALIADRVWETLAPVLR
ncbi:MAG: arylesterase [Myxococcota bacterium]